MTEKTVVVSARIPKELSTTIDEKIKAFNHFTSRSGYVLFSMENMFREFVTLKINTNEQIEKFRQSLGDMDPQVVDTVTKRVIDNYFQEYTKYEGENVQILVRAPEGLIQSIEQYASLLGYYSSVKEFICLAIMNQIKNDEILEFNLQSLDENRVKKIKDSNELVQAIMDSIKSNPNQLDGLINIFSSALDLKTK